MGLDQINPSFNASLAKLKWAHSAHTLMNGEGVRRKVRIDRVGHRSWTNGRQVDLAFSFRSYTQLRKVLYNFRFQVTFSKRSLLWRQFCCFMQLHHRDKDPSKDPWQLKLHKHSTFNLQWQRSIFIAFLATHADWQTMALRQLTPRIMDLNLSRSCPQCHECSLLRGIDKWMSSRAHALVLSVDADLEFPYVETEKFHVIEQCPSFYLVPNLFCMDWKETVFL